MANVLRPEKSLWELTPSFDHVGLKDQIQALRFGGQYLYQLSHHIGSFVAFLSYIIQRM